MFEAQLDDLIDLFTADPSTPARVRLAHELSELIVSTSHVTHLETRCLNDENPQVRRLGLTALRLNAGAIRIDTSRFTELKRIFTKALDDVYPWCVVDAVWGLQVLAPFSISDLVPRIEVLLTHSHEGTQARARACLEAVNHLTHPSFERIEEPLSGFELNKPVGWLPVEDPLLPFSFVAPEQSYLTLKLARLLPAQPTSVEAVIEASTRAYAKTWEVLETIGSTLVIDQHIGPLVTRAVKTFLSHGPFVTIQTYGFPREASEVMVPFAKRATGVSTP